MNRDQVLQHAVDRLVDALEETGPVAIALPKHTGGWRINISANCTDDDTGEINESINLDWEQMRLVQATEELHLRGWRIPEDACLASNRHGGWANQNVIGGWSAPVYRA